MSNFEPRDPVKLDTNTSNIKDIPTPPQPHNRYDNRRLTEDMRREARRLVERHDSTAALIPAAREWAGAHGWPVDPFVTLCRELPKPRFDIA